MADNATKLAVKHEDKKAAPTPATREWWPFESLRREIDRLFDDFDQGSWRNPFRGSAFDMEPSRKRRMTLDIAPAVDIAERDKEYEITAELPGLDENDLEVKLANGTLTIRGEKKEEIEEKKKDYYLSERRYGSFQRSFPVPEGVDSDKIEARFKKGVLTVTLPKTAESLKKEKKISVNAS